MSDMTMDQWMNTLIDINPSYDPANNNNPGFSARNNAEEIKTQFLTLLVAQMKNQDPMNPVDNQDFVSQLSQFSSLEQLITISEGVENFNGKMKYLNDGVDYIATLLTYVAIPGAEGEEGAEGTTEGDETPATGDDPAGA